MPQLHAAAAQHACAPQHRGNNACLRLVLPPLQLSNPELLKNPKTPAGLARSRAWLTASSACARCCARAWRAWARRWPGTTSPTRSACLPTLESAPSRRALHLSCRRCIPHAVAAAPPPPTARVHARWPLLRVLLCPAGGQAHGGALGVPDPQRPHQVGAASSWAQHCKGLACCSLGR